MKRWALVVVLLYFLIVVALTVPVLTLAFFQTSEPMKMGEIFKVYSWWPYWLWLVVMLLGQAGLLAVPVRVASRRPVTRRSLLLPVLAAGLMMGGLAWGA